MAGKGERWDATVLWRGADILSAEYCRFEAAAGRRRLSGLVILPVHDHPGHIRYVVEADEGWNTRRARVTFTTPQGSHGISLEADGEGHWLLEGSPIHSLDGCLDVDLGFTPATNTLPLRRVAATGDDEFDITAALVRFPESDVVRSEQTYQRMSPTAWRFSSGSFRAELQVDRMFIVRRYGPGLWEAVAAT